MNVVIFGLLAVSLGLWGMSVWWWSVAELLRGLIPIVLVFVGVVSLAAGVSNIRKEKEADDEDLIEGES
ncbi:magnetosome protein MamI [Magnetovibrio sp. PR-2]|uniref:magnetosome protein MamI n=1 Tax=Magnetovibrio sp. PR-2 TaxID=3120356 RepID=UPI002FCE1D00